MKMLIFLSRSGHQLRGSIDELAKHDVVVRLDGDHVTIIKDRDNNLDLEIRDERHF